MVLFLVFIRFYGFMATFTAVNAFIKLVFNPAVIIIGGEVRQLIIILIVRLNSQHHSLTLDSLTLEVLTGRARQLFLAVSAANEFILDHGSS